MAHIRMVGATKCSCGVEACGWATLEQTYVKMALGQIHFANELPFIDYEQIAARFVASICFYVESQWRTLVEIADGRYMEVAAWPAEMAYFGQVPEQATDYNSYLLNFLAQHGNRAELRPQFSAIEEDIFSLSASFAKLRLIHASTDHGTGRMAATEVEYILLVCRSIFDLLQELLAKTWKTIIKTNGTKTKELKKTFSAMVLEEKEGIRTAEQIAAKFDIPEALAHCYAQHAPLFGKIRKFRDSIVHGWSQAEPISRGERDFLIRKQLGPFKNLDIWREEEMEPNGLAPLTPALALMVQGTLLACDDFARVLQALIRFPPPTVPNMHLFLRGYFNQVFAELINDANERAAEYRRLVQLPLHPWAVGAADPNEETGATG